jgi:hypothetical protein
MKLSILSRLLIVVAISSLVSSLSNASCKCKTSDSYEELIHNVNESFANSMWDDALECLTIARQASYTSSRVNEVYFFENLEHYYKTAMSLKEGKEAFDNGLWDDAIKYYEKVMKALPLNIPNKDNDKIILQVAQSYYKSVIKLEDSGRDMDNIRRKIRRKIDRIVRKTENTKQGSLFYLADVGLRSLDSPVDIDGAEINLQEVNIESQYILIADYYLKNDLWSDSINQFEYLREYYEDTGNIELETTALSIQALVRALEIRDSRDDPNDEIWRLLNEAVFVNSPNNVMAKWLIGWIIWYVQEQYKDSMDDVNDFLPEWLIKNQSLLEEVNGVYSSVSIPLTKEMFPAIKITDKDGDIKIAEDLLNKNVTSAFYNLGEYFNELQKPLDNVPPVIEVMGWNHMDEIKTSTESVRIPLFVHDDSMIKSITWKLYKDNGKTFIKKGPTPEIMIDNNTYFNWLDVKIPQGSYKTAYQLDIIAEDVLAEDTKSTFRLNILYLPRVYKDLRYAYVIGAQKYEMSSLQGVVDYDVKPILEYLLTVGGFSKDKIKVWVDTRFDESIDDLGLKQKNIHIGKIDPNVIIDIKKDVKHRLEEDSEIFFYYSGHGDIRYNSNGENKYYVLKLNGDIKDEDSVYDIKELLNNMTINTKPRRFFFMLDACFTGGGIKKLNSIPDKKERFVIAAAKPDETAPMSDSSVLTKSFLNTVKDMPFDVDKGLNVRGVKVSDGFITSGEVLKAMEDEMMTDHAKFWQGRVENDGAGNKQVIGFLPEYTVAINCFDRLKTDADFNSLNSNIAELIDSDFKEGSIAMRILLERARGNIASDKETVDLLEAYYKFNDSLRGSR